MIAQESGSNPKNISTPDNLAYVVYASDTTEKPKGVSIQIYSLVEHINGYRKYFEISKGMNFAFTNYATDMGYALIFPSIVTGGSVHIISKNILSDTRAFGNYIRTYDIDGLKIDSSHLRILLSREDPKKVLPRRFLILGGENFEVELCKQIKFVSPDCEVLYYYEPMEITVGSITCNILENSLSLLTITVAKTIANTKVYILDRKMNPVPIGVPGELYIAGDGLSKRYLNHPELTTERFVPNPFVDKTGERMYKTGDLVYYLPDGSLRFIGRINKQAKICGYWIDIGEIEFVLKQCEGIQEAIVEMKEDTPRDKSLVAYIVGESQSDTQLLRKKLIQRLPAYMVPTTYVWLEQIPLTPNGKVDRKILDLTNFQSSIPEERITGVSRDKLEFEMLSLWNGVLENQNINMDSDFFEVGGHSLKVILLVETVMRKFGIDIPITTLIENATPRKLCNAIRNQVSIESSRIVNIKPGNDKEHVFFVHPGGGGVFCYVDLARRLNTDATIYGIQALGIDTNDEPLWDLDEIVDLYVNEICKINDGELIYFVGWSSGGTFAYEMVRRLEKMGRNIECVILFDTLAVYPELTKYNLISEKNKKRSSERLQYWKIFCESKGVNIPEIEDLTEEEIIEWMNTNAYKNGVLHPDVSREMARRELKVSVATFNALRQYTLDGQICTDINWIIASEHSTNNDNFRFVHENEWRKRTKGQFCTWESPGTHKNMLLRPHVDHLATIVESIICTKK
ncbi:AMP-binding protein [Bacillus sp. DHT2]|nr:AMP-binding protein [Bacillus sp. DHT2]